MTRSADFSAINSKFASKNIRQLGLKVPTMVNLESDSDDEDFDDNSAANQESEDVDYRGDEGNNESSDSEDAMDELVPESDDEERASSEAVGLAVGHKAQKRMKLNE